jgi:hypothetical protein
MHRAAPLLTTLLPQDRGSSAAAISRLVHLHPPIATSVIGHNGGLVHLMDLADWVRDSFNWR